jgi:glycosyltransferase involved in cell wall biosynthesis
MVEHGRSGLLVPVGDDAAMAREAIRVLADASLRTRLVAAGLEEARRYAWPQVREQWRRAYWRAVEGAKAA